MFLKFVSDSMMLSIDVREFFKKKILAYFGIDYEFLENIILKQEKDQKAVAKCQVEKKKISALKQKLLFYLSYLRTRTSDEFTFIKNEVREYSYIDCLIE